MNLLQELRQVARATPKRAVKKRTQAAADELDLALSALVLTPTTEAMQRVNGAWANGVRVLAAAPPLGGNGAGAGRMAVPKYEDMRKVA